MNNKPGHIEQDVLKILWKKFQPYVIYVVTIIVCIIVFFTVVTSLYRDLLQIREDEKTTRNKITLLKNNLQFLATLNDQTVNKEFDIAFTALPAEKDFVGIINGITRSSVNAGVVLNDFSFNVGTIASQSAVAEAQPSIKIDLSVQGTITATNQFIKNLSETFPMSNPINLAMSTNGSSVQMSFYYKPVTPASNDVTAPLKRLSVSDGKLLESMEPQYDAIQVGESVFTQPTAVPVASSSGTVSPTPQVTVNPSP